MAWINVYDSKQWALWGLINSDTIQVGSVSDMVEKVLVKTNGGVQSHLFINGEGLLNYQSVGAGANYDPSGDRSLQVDEDGNLKGGARVWIPRLTGKVKAFHLYGIDDEDGRSFPLIQALAKALGVGGTVYTSRSMLIWYGEGTLPRRLTDSATVDRDKMRKRISEYTKG